jgi:hypothetical protein
MQQAKHQPVRYAALDVVDVDDSVYADLANRLLGHVYITNEDADITA